MGLSYWWVGQCDKINILIPIIKNLEIWSPLLLLFSSSLKKVRIWCCKFQLFLFILFPSWLKYLGNKVYFFFIMIFFLNKTCHLKIFWFMLWPSLGSNPSSVSYAMGKWVAKEVTWVGTWEWENWIEWKVLGRFLVLKYPIMVVYLQKNHICSFKTLKNFKRTNVVFL